MVQVKNMYDSKIDNSLLLVLLATLALPSIMFYGGARLSDVSFTTPQYVPLDKNSTLQLLPWPRGEFSQGFFASGTYKASIDLNNTVSFSIYKLSSNLLESRDFCNITGTVILFRETAKLNESFELPTGTYAYLLCNRSQLTTFGTFQLALYENVTTKPYRNFGNYVQALAFPAFLWGALLTIEGASKRSKFSRYVRVLRWLVVAPVFFTFLVGGLSSVFYLDSKDEYVDYLFLLSESPYLLADSMKLLEPPLLSLSVLSFIMAPVTVATICLSVFTHYMKGLSEPKVRRVGRPWRLVSEFFDSQFAKKFSGLVLPENPNLGVCVRFAVLSLFVLEVFYVAPTELIQQLTGTFGALIPQHIFSSGILTLFLTGAVSCLAMVAYFLKWWSPIGNYLRRLVGLIFVWLGLGAFAVLLYSLFQSVDFAWKLSSLTYLFLLPLLLCAYVESLLLWGMWKLTNKVQHSTFRAPKRELKGLAGT